MFGVDYRENEQCAVKVSFFFGLQLINLTRAILSEPKDSVEAVHLNWKLRTVFCKCSQLRAAQVQAKEKKGGRGMTQLDEITP